MWGIESTVYRGYRENGFHPVIKIIGLDYTKPSCCIFTTSFRGEGREREQGEEGDREQGEDGGREQGE